MISNRSPINKQAAVVAFAKGERFISVKKIVNRDRDEPYQYREPLNTEENHVCKKFGRLTALGIYTPTIEERRRRFDKGKRNKGGMWVCRCDCGRHCLRKAKAIKNPQNRADACEICRELIAIKRSYIWRTEGRNVEAEELIK